MRVTEKGQVTIPLNIRRHLGINAGSEVEFEFIEDGAVLRRVTASQDEADQNARELREHFRRFKGTMNLGGMTPDEFYAMLRD